MPFPFHSRLISVRLPFLFVFKPFPFCPKGSPSVLVNDPESIIKRAQSLIVQEASRQFSDRDRARTGRNNTHYMLGIYMLSHDADI